MDKITDKLPVQRIYSLPEISCIKLDNEISLALESAPPVFPGETFLKTPDYFNSDPLKINIG